jgi:hypothetical protein
MVAADRSDTTQSKFFSGVPIVLSRNLEVPSVVLLPDVAVDRVVAGKWRNSSWNGC